MSPSLHSAVPSARHAPPALDGLATHACWELSLICPVPPPLRLALPLQRQPLCTPRVGSSVPPPCRPPIRSPRTLLALPSRWALPPAVTGAMPPQGRAQWDAPWGTRLILTTALGKDKSVPSFLLAEKKCMCAHTCLGTCGSGHQTPEGRSPGITQPHWLWPTGGPLAFRAPCVCSDTQTPGSAQAGLPWCPAVSQ